MSLHIPISGFGTRAALLAVLVLAGTLFVGCEQKDASLQETLEQAQTKAGELTETAGEFAAVVGNLSEEKIEKIAEIASKLESAPAEARKLLDRQDWSMEEFETMVDAIEKNETAKKVFDAAKAKFAQN